MKQRSLAGVFEAVCSSCHMHTCCVIVVLIRCTFLLLLFYVVVRPFGLRKYVMAVAPVEAIEMFCLHEARHLLVCVEEMSAEMRIQCKCTIMLRFLTIIVHVLPPSRCISHSRSSRLII